MPIYYGVDGKACKITDIYYGVRGKAKTVKYLYLGVNGKAVKIYTRKGIDKDNPIYVTSLKDFKEKVLVDPNGYYTMARDWNVTSKDDMIDGSIEFPEGVKFTGTLDGNGHKIFWYSYPIIADNYGTIENIGFGFSKICNNNYGTLRGLNIKRNFSSNNFNDVRDGICINNYGTIYACYMNYNSDGNMNNIQYMVTDNYGTIDSISISYNARPEHHGEEITKDALYFTKENHNGGIIRNLFARINIIPKVFYDGFWTSDCKLYPTLVNNGTLEGEYDNGIVYDTSGNNEAWLEFHNSTNSTLNLPQDYFNGAYLKPEIGGTL